MAQKEELTDILWNAILENDDDFLKKLRASYSADNSAARNASSNTKASNFLAPLSDLTESLYSNIFQSTESSKSNALNEKIAELNNDLETPVFSGIGVDVVYDEEEKGYRVTKSYAGSENGLKEGDIIKAVIDENGETLQVSEHNDDKLIPLIRGQVGTTAKLLVNKERKPREIIRRLMDVEKGAALDIKALLQVPVLQERLEQLGKSFGELSERFNDVEREFTEQLEEHKKQTQQQLTTHKDKTNAALTEQSTTINARVDGLSETVESNHTANQEAIADSERRFTEQLEEHKQQTQEQVGELTEQFTTYKGETNTALAEQSTTINDISTRVGELSGTVESNHTANQEAIADSEGRFTEQLEEHKQQTNTTLAEQSTTINAKVDRLSETVVGNQQANQEGIAGITEQLAAHEQQTNEKFEEKHTALTNLLEERIASTASESEIALNTAISQVYSTTDSTTDNKIAAERTAREEATTTQNQSITNLTTTVAEQGRKLDEGLEKIPAAVQQAATQIGQALQNSISGVEERVDRMEKGKVTILGYHVGKLTLETPENSQGSGRSGNNR